MGSGRDWRNWDPDYNPNDATDPRNRPPGWTFADPDAPSEEVQEGLRVAMLALLRDRQAPAARPQPATRRQPPGNWQPTDEEKREIWRRYDEANRRVRPMLDGVRRRRDAFLNSNPRDADWAEAQFKKAIRSWFAS